MFPTLQGYDAAKQLLGDVVAGLTVGALAVPQSLSYARICGLPAQAGLYSDLQVVYPVVGSSRYLVVGPVAVMSLMVHAALKSDGFAVEFTPEWGALASLLCVLVGLIQLAVAALGGGTRLSTLLSESAIKGFTAAAAVTILSTQVPELTGAPKCPADCSVFANLVWPFVYGSPAPKALLLSALSLAVLEGFRYLPGSVTSKMGALVVICCGVAAEVTVGPLGLNVVGAIPQSLPTFGHVLAQALTIDSLGPRALRLAFQAFAIALVGFAEAFAIARANAAKYDKDRALAALALHPDRELAALAMANVWTGVLGGFPVTGSFSRSAVNADAGATSAMSPVVAALFVALVLTRLTGWLALLPRACVASIVVSAVLRLIDFAYIAHVLKGTVDRTDRLLFALVAMCGIVFGIEAGLVVGAVGGAIVPRLFGPGAELPAASAEDVEKLATS